MNKSKRQKEIKKTREERRALLVAATRTPSLPPPARAMGVNGLTPYLKQAASKSVALDDGEDTDSKSLIVVGHFAMHSAAGVGSVSVSLVLDDDILPLAL